MTTNDLVDFESRLNLASEKFVKSDYDSCIQLCGELLKVSSNNVRIHMLLGACYFHTKHYEHSLTFFNNVILLNPEIADAYYNIGNVFVVQNKFPESLSYFQQSLILKPDFSMARGAYAAVLLRIGKLYESALEYQYAVNLDNNNVNWLIDLGHVYVTLGYYNRAKIQFQEAIKLETTNPIAWYNLALTNKEEKQYTTSIVHLRHVLSFKPDFVEAYLCLSECYSLLKCVERSIHTLETGIKLCQKPFSLLISLATYKLKINSHDADATLEQLNKYDKSPDEVCSLANFYLTQGKKDVALEWFYKASELNPQNGEILNVIGSLLRDQGKAQDAENMFRKALEITPNSSSTHCNLGNLLKDKQSYLEALYHYQQCIQLTPWLAEGHSNMGNVLKDLNRFDEAIQCYLKAIQLKPQFADAYANMAAVYKDSFRYSEAIFFYRKALDLGTGCSNDLSLANLLHTLQMICDWEGRDAVLSKLIDTIQRQIKDNQLPSVQPHHALVYPFSAELQTDIAKQYALGVKRNVEIYGKIPYFDDFQDRCTCQGSSSCTGFNGLSKTQNQKIRIGYVSSDLGNHPLAHLMQSVFGYHDKSMFEVYLYCLSPDDHSEYSIKIRNSVDCVKDITKLNYLDSAQLIHNDKVHILINLNGYTKGARNEIFALRPSPIQCLYMGFPGTTGADYIQYIITDKITSPQELSSLYTEILAYLPDNYFVSDYASIFPDCRMRHLTTEQINEGRSKLGLPSYPTTVYCMFNQLYKIDPEIFHIWVNILKQVPNSVLWLLQFPPQGEENIRKSAQKLGLEPHKLIFTPVAEKKEHVSRGIYADLFLDTPLCNAHTTGTDILWSGTPMITIPGKTFASRVGASLVSALGCPELICHTYEEYTKKAIYYGSNVNALKELKDKIARNKLTEPLFNTRLWVANLDKLFIKMLNQFSESVTKHKKIKIISVD